MSYNKSIYIENSILALKDDVIEQESVLVEDGFISAISPVATPDVKNIDMKGKYLLPGMIDLHCDALEKEIEPRPLVHFLFSFDCAQADKRNAATGITTVFHALSFASEELDVRNNEMAAPCTGR